MEVGAVLAVGMAAASAAGVGACLATREARREGGLTRRLDDAVGSGARLLLASPVLVRLRLRSEASRRRAACLHEMPVLIDTLTLGLSSGLSFDASLELYCGRFDTELGRAFSEAMLSWRIGTSSREGALRALSEELGISALSRFASVVSESLAFGTPLASALETQARALREEQRAQTEEQIEKASVKMLIPLGTLIVPAMLLAILGPLLASAVSTAG